MNLNDLVKKYEGLSQSVDKIKPAITQKIHASIMSQFSSGQDPYGNKWAALKAGGQPTLSGVLPLTVSFNSIGIHIDLNYIGIFHHKGWTRQGAGRTRRQRRASGTIQVARPVLSSGKLPDTWSNIIELEFHKCLV